MEKWKKMILVVDDDKKILESLKVILESEGYSVDIAETGREALEKSRVQLYDLALLDVKLPDMEGTQVLRIVHDSHPRMVKIMMTGYPSLENAVASLKHGADRYIMKPVNPERLLKIIEERLNEPEEIENITEE